MDVSVIIPTYNRLWCLPRAINSCRQTKCKTEIIVVDDGSTDGTWQWLEQQDLTAIYQPNQGQTYAINNGTKAARGKYVRFLDSDDFLADGIIDLQFEVAENTSGKLICSRVDNYNETTKEITISPNLRDWGDFLEVQLGNGYGSHFLGMLFHHDLVESVPRRPDFAWREDRMFLLEVGLLNPRLVIIDVCAGYWVKHADQMQSKYSGFKSQVVNWQHLHIYKRILGELDKQKKLSEKYKKAACTVLWPLAHWIAINHLKEACDVVNWIYQLNPKFSPPEKGLLGLLYRKIGFKLTEHLLVLRRSIVSIIRWKFKTV